MYEIISTAKEERIGKQYYVDFDATEENAEEFTKKAQDFTIQLIQLKYMIETLKNEDIERARKEVKSM